MTIVLIPVSVTVESKVLAKLNGMQCGREDLMAFLWII